MKTTAVILAAGQGTRMKSDLPKVLHQVAGKPMIQWVIDKLKEAQVTTQIAVLGHQGEAVAAVVGEQAQVVYQREQRGTGHAVMQAAALLPAEAGCVLVVCGDTPLISASTLQALLAQHQQQGNAVTVLTAIAEAPFGYGRIMRQADGHIVAIVEEKDATAAQKALTEINAGTYCFDQQFLLEALPQLSTDNAQGEYYLTDVIGLAVKAGRLVDGYVLPCFEESLGINNRLQLAQAEKIMGRRKLEQLMLQGVTIIDPAHTYVAPEVVVGQDTVLYPGVMLEGQTVIGARCRIGAHTRITDSQLGDEIEVEQSVIWQAQVGDGCHIGPFAYLRPGATLGDGVKIGDFVEIKKSTIGQGTKVPHLTYVGDATVGVGVNIGCGTITCNYDGHHKYPTVIGDHVFVGSNTNLIAPITVADHAFIGAGSTLSKDVPANCLAFTRAELKIKENWGKNK